jgi:hypothetical protein
MSEVMPMQIRGKGNAFATGVGNWAVATLWAQVSPIALGKLGWKFYFVFVAWSKSHPHRGVIFLKRTNCLLDICITLPVIYFFFKETKQKSLEEIDLLFGGRALGTLPENVAEKAEETGVSVTNVEHHV